MEWDPDEIQVDTLHPNDIKADTLLSSDPRIHIGTITSNKVVAGTLDLGANLTEEQLAYLRRAVMRGSS